MSQCKAAPISVITHRYNWRFCHQYSIFGQQVQKCSLVGFYLVFFFFFGIINSFKGYSRPFSMHKLTFIMRRAFETRSLSFTRFLFIIIIAYQCFNRES